MNTLDALAKTLRELSEVMGETTRNSLEAMKDMAREWPYPDRVEALNQLQDAEDCRSQMLIGVEDAAHELEMASKAYTRWRQELKYWDTENVA